MRHSGYFLKAKILGVFQIYLQSLKGKRQLHRWLEYCSQHFSLDVLPLIGSSQNPYNRSSLHLPKAEDSRGKDFLQVSDVALETA